MIKANIPRFLFLFASHNKQHTHHWVQFTKRLLNINDELWSFSFFSFICLLLFFFLLPCIPLRNEIMALAQFGISLCGRKCEMQRAIHRSCYQFIFLSFHPIWDKSLIQTGRHRFNHRVRLNGILCVRSCNCFHLQCSILKLIIFYNRNGSLLIKWFCSNRFGNDSKSHIRFVSKGKIIYQWLRWISISIYSNEWFQNICIVSFVCLFLLLKFELLLQLTLSNLAHFQECQSRSE